MTDSLWRDVRYAARSLGRARGFTAVAVLTLALAMGATTAVFSVVDGVLLKPLPVHEQERLLVVWTAVPERGTEHWPFSYASYEGMRERLRCERFARLRRRGRPRGSWEMNRRHKGDDRGNEHGLHDFHDRLLHGEGGAFSRVRHRLARRP